MMIQPKYLPKNFKIEAGDPKKLLREKIQQIDNQIYNLLAEIEKKLGVSTNGEIRQSYKAAKCLRNQFNTYVEQLGERVDSLNSFLFNSVKSFLRLQSGDERLAKRLKNALFDVEEVSESEVYVSLKLLRRINAPLKLCCRAIRKAYLA